MFRFFLWGDIPWKKKNLSMKLNMKWEQFYWPISLIHSAPSRPKKPRKLVTYNPCETLPPHSLQRCLQRGRPSSLVPDEYHLIKLFLQLLSWETRSLSKAWSPPTPPLWERAAELAYLRSSPVELWPTFPGCTLSVLDGCDWLRYERAPCSCHFSLFICSICFMSWNVPLTEERGESR